MTHKIFSSSEAARAYARENNLQTVSRSFNTGFGEESGYDLIDGYFDTVESVIVREFWDGNTCYYDRGYIDAPYVIEDAATGTQIEDATCIDNAIAIIAEYEATDREEGNYCPDFYCVRNMMTEEIVDLSIHA